MNDFPKGWEPFDWRILFRDIGWREAAIVVVCGLVILLA